MYAYNSPVRFFDFLGLTAADVQGVFRDVASSFWEINRAKPRVDFQPMRPGQDGATDKWSGQMYVDPSWANKACFTRPEYEDLFFTLFHEGMHSSDPLWRRIITSNSTGDAHHNSIYRRELFERYRPPRPSGDMWGSTRGTAVDLDRLYNQYRRRTPACCESN